MQHLEQAYRQFQHRLVATATGPAPGLLGPNALRSLISSQPHQSRQSSQQQQQQQAGARRALMPLAAATAFGTPDSAPDGSGYPSALLSGPSSTAITPATLNRLEISSISPAGHQMPSSLSLQHQPTSSTGTFDGLTAASRDARLARAGPSSANQRPGEVNSFTLVSPAPPPFPEESLSGSGATTGERYHETSASPRPHSLEPAPAPTRDRHALSSLVASPSLLGTGAGAPSLGIVGTAINIAGSSAVGRSLAAVVSSSTPSSTSTSAGVATTHYLPSIYSSSVLTAPPQTSSVPVTRGVSTPYSAATDSSDSLRDRMPRSLMTTDILQRPSRGLSQLSPTAVTTSGEQQFDKDSQVSSVSALSRTNMSAGSTGTVVPAHPTGLTAASSGSAAAAASDQKDSGAPRAAVSRTGTSEAPHIQKVPEKTFQSTQLGVATTGPLHASPSSLGSPLKSGRSVTETSATSERTGASASAEDESTHASRPPVPPDVPPLDLDSLWKRSADTVTATSASQDELTGTGGGGNGQQSGTNWILSSGSPPPAAKSAPPKPNPQQQVAGYSSSLDFSVSLPTTTQEDKSKAAGDSKSGAAASAGASGSGADVRSSAEQYMAMFAKQPTTGDKAATTGTSDTRPAMPFGGAATHFYEEEPELELETGDSATRDTKQKGKSAVDDDRSEKDDKSDPFW